MWKKRLLSVLRLVVSRVLRLYATCSPSWVPIRCSLLAWSFGHRAGPSLFAILQLLPPPPSPYSSTPFTHRQPSTDLEVDPCADVDEIGYKFICPFKRDIVLLLDKANGQSYVWRTLLLRGCVLRAIQEKDYGVLLSSWVWTKRRKRKTKYDVIKRQRVTN